MRTPLIERLRNWLAGLDSYDIGLEKEPVIVCSELGAFVVDRHPLRPVGDPTIPDKLHDTAVHVRP